MDYEFGTNGQNFRRCKMDRTVAEKNPFIQVILEGVAVDEE